MMIQYERGIEDEVCFFIILIPTIFLLRILFWGGSATDFEGDFTSDKGAETITLLRVLCGL